jgi:hypothetical protein
MISRAAILAALTFVAGHSSASAQSWPPPGYRYGEPPVVYAPAPPPAVYVPAPPVVYVPAPAPEVRSAVSPDAVFDALERAGYREFSPMAFRDGVYKLNAVNRRGDLVALEVSVLDGQVEREFILEARRAAPDVPPQLPRRLPVAPPPTPVAPSEDPLVVY